MTGSAVERFDPGTGEVLPVIERFNFGEYLREVGSPGAVAHQQQLAAAYDAAVKSLIGPNDVQQEGAREFKKKSAWRKLQRHFGISTSVTTIERGREGEHFIATVTVRASAPWGQYAEAVGACGTDEAVGRRVITIADAIATAETRATNRAVSNLIAMGEVSAEEIGDRGGVVTLPGKPASWEGNGGKPITEVPSAVLSKAVTWLKGRNEDGKNTALIQTIDEELEGRRLANEDGD